MKWSEASAGCGVYSVKNAALLNINLSLQSNEMSQKSMGRGHRIFNLLKYRVNIKQVLKYVLVLYLNNRGGMEPCEWRLALDQKACYTLCTYFAFNDSRLPFYFSVISISFPKECWHGTLPDKSLSRCHPGVRFEFEKLNVITIPTSHANTLQLNATKYF